MKQYLIDEIARSDLSRIKEYLDDRAQTSGLEGIWWVELGKEQLSDGANGPSGLSTSLFRGRIGSKLYKI